MRSLAALMEAMPPFAQILNQTEERGLGIFAL